MSTSNRWIVGVDEAGRGPWAGPVAVGVFAIPENGYDDLTLCCARDSKTLTPTARELWSTRLKDVPGARWAVTLSSATSIDRRGIVVAIFRALTRALSRIDIEPSRALILLDGGLHAPHKYTHQHTIVRGDSTERVIAAASILAKTFRDAHMCRVARVYPQYGFTRHKGYGTPEHRIALFAHGMTPIHRSSFIHFLP